VLPRTPCNILLSMSVSLKWFLSLGFVNENSLVRVLEDSKSATGHNQYSAGIQSKSKFCTILS
jgi:hypothetical protein